MTHGHAYVMQYAIYTFFFFLHSDLSSTAFRISAWTHNSNMSLCQRWLAALCHNYKAEGEDKDRLPSHAHPTPQG